MTPILFFKAAVVLWLSLWVAEIAMYLVFGGDPFRYRRGKNRQPRFLFDPMMQTFMLSLTKAGIVILLITLCLLFS